MQLLASLPDTIKRVGNVEAFPNEYPGMIYAFNWALNGDGVTPLRGSAFRINKTLDLKVAGLELPKVQPLKVNDFDYCSELLRFPYIYCVGSLTIFLNCYYRYFL